MMYLKFLEDATAPSAVGSVYATKVSVAAFSIATLLNDGLNR